MELADFAYTNPAEVLPEGIDDTQDFNLITDKLEKLILDKADKNIDELTGKQVRMMPGGMTVWYLMEALAFSDTCMKIAAQMRSTRNWNETASSEQILNGERNIRGQNYDLTISELFSLHGAYCDAVYKHLDIETDNLLSRVPACALSDWREKYRRYRVTPEE